MKTLFDPVCGMTVDESAFRAEGYDDVAFCSPGCRAAFLADPDAYAKNIADASATETDESSGSSHGPGHHGEPRDDHSESGGHHVNHDAEAHHDAGSP
jgi:YHS domain-containing protein